MNQKSEKIIINGAKCLICQDYVESKNTHSLVSCKCGAMAVDGGKKEKRRIGNPYLIRECSVILIETNTKHKSFPISLS